MTCSSTDCSKETVAPFKMCPACRASDASRKSRRRHRRRLEKAGSAESKKAEVVSYPDEFEIIIDEPAAPVVTSLTTPLEAAQRAHTKAREARNIKAEHKALFEENLRQRQIIEELGRMSRAPEILVYTQPAWERSDAIACAIASDWHVEEPVTAEAVHRLNEYNLDIAKSRAEKFFQHWLRLTDIHAKDSKINTMYLAALGDFFTGWLVDEMMASNLLAPGDAAHFCKGLFFSGIDFLLRESAYILEGDCIPGNHGRLTDRIHFANPTGTSLETFMYHAIADRYRDNPRVRLHVSEHAMRYRRFYETFNLRLIHGYEVKYGGGVGGITIPIRKALAQWNNPIRADLTAMGHFHQRCDGGDFLVNGSLIGYNTFAQNIKAAFEEAQQSFFLISARKGGQKSVVAPIWLDDSHKKVLV
jgi:hypothetical protein